MAFDWISFLDRNGIEYVSSGPNVSRGNVNISCPFCGSADASHHMGISLHGKGWACWRNSDHRGKSPIRLVQTILGCSRERALQIVGVDRNLPTNFLDQVQSQFHDDELQQNNSVLRMPKEFLSFSDKPSCKLFWQYMVNKRGFTKSEVKYLSKKFDVRYCSRGPFKGRVIFPIVFKRELVSWVGRTVYEIALPRYKVLTNDYELSDRDGCGVAKGPIIDYLLWYDTLINCDRDTICLVEGPMDAARIEVVGRMHGIAATCFFTSSPSESQIDLLYQLLPKFRHRFLLPDKGAEAVGLRTLAKLPSLNVVMKSMPKNINDPGEIDENQLLNLLFDKVDERIVK